MPTKSIPQSKFVWIDAICINQDDLDERPAQVKLMGAQYSQAERVVAWLGPADATCPEAFSLLNRVAFLGRDAVVNGQLLPWDNFEPDQRLIAGCPDFTVGVFQASTIILRGEKAARPNCNFHITTSATHGKHGVACRPWPRGKRFSVSPTFIEQARYVYRSGGAFGELDEMRDISTNLRAVLTTVQQQNDILRGLNTPHTDLESRCMKLLEEFVQSLDSIVVLENPGKRDAEFKPWMPVLQLFMARGAKWCAEQDYGDNMSVRNSTADDEWLPRHW
ncbi:hypothetical protein B0H63DRAFT_515459 [Podospora didyma]|uniref:Heterokaryon incompatibility domain-containing protein n=1 Tax=Podospora didyma TaxID=330526 RepID=A0AAE0N2E5_9PEZI|nr:hypothetical protein B0H63DRAFT_515459 [Podospora didyma]